MIFALWCIDKPGTAEVRARLLQEHRAYWSAMRDKMAFGGPLTTNAGDAIVGSLIVVEFDSRKALDDWLSQEPFVVGGLYESVTIHDFRNVWPQQVGFPPPMP